MSTIHMGKIMDRSSENAQKLKRFLFSNYLVSFENMNLNEVQSY